MANAMMRALGKTLEKLDDLRWSLDAPAVSRPQNAAAFLMQETLHIHRCMGQLQQCLNEDLPDAWRDEDAEAVAIACRQLPGLLHDCLKGEARVESLETDNPDALRWQGLLEAVWSDMLRAMDVWRTDAQSAIDDADVPDGIPGWGFDVEHEPSLMELVDYLTDMTGKGASMEVHREAGIRGLPLLGMVLLGLAAIGWIMSGD